MLTNEFWPVDASTEIGAQSNERFREPVWTAPGQPEELWSTVNSTDEYGVTTPLKET